MKDYLGQELFEGDLVLIADMDSLYGELTHGRIIDFSEPTDHWGVSQKALVKYEFEVDGEKHTDELWLDFNALVKLEGPLLTKFLLTKA